MYTINEYRSPSPTYCIPRDAVRECGRENIIRELEADAEGRHRGTRVCKRFTRLAAALIGIRLDQRERPQDCMLARPNSSF
jgi:hypothetical protein